MNSILLIGCGGTALTALESLLRRFRVLALVREGDENDDVVTLARRNGIPVHADVRPTAVAAVVRDTKPDAVVVSSYNRILRPDVLQLSRFVNVHYAPLPRYRGRACVNWAIINGESHTAITVHELVPQLDAGAVLFQQKLPIGPDDTVGELYDRLNALQLEHLGAAVERYLRGEQGLAQDDRHATYGCTRLPQDGEIDWTAPPAAVHALVRALSQPFPGAFTFLGGDKLTVWKSALPKDSPRYEGRVAGRVVSVSRAGVDVLAGNEGIVRLIKVQKNDGEICDAADVIASVKVTLGLQPAKLLERIEELERKLAALRAG